VAPHLRRPAKASQRAPPNHVARVLIGKFWFSNNLSLGYNTSVDDLNKAASLMGRKSAEARKKKWGKKEFVRKMQEWGNLGGRPKGSGKKKKKAR
jgi:hypothetical protein